MKLRMPIINLMLALCGWGGSHLSVWLSYSRMKKANQATHTGAINRFNTYEKRPRSPSESIVVVIFSF